MPPNSAPFTALRALTRSTVTRPLTTCNGYQIVPRQFPRQRISTQRSFSSTLRPFNKPSASAKPLLEYPDPATQPQSEPRPEVPSYELSFTCVPCSTRSSHKITKQGYHFGSVLITCPECRNRHIISDHLKIFGDKDITVEDLMKERGELFKKGTLSEDGDIEFWQDGTTTKRLKAQEEELKDTLKRGWTPVELSPESRPKNQHKNQPEKETKNPIEIQSKD